MLNDAKLSKYSWGSISASEDIVVTTIWWFDSLKNEYFKFSFCVSLTHYSPVLVFYNPRKHQKKQKVSFFFLGYIKPTPGCNGLIILHRLHPRKMPGVWQIRWDQNSKRFKVTFPPNKEVAISNLVVLSFFFVHSQSWTEVSGVFTALPNGGCFAKIVNSFWPTTFFTKKLHIDVCQDS